MCSPIDVCPTENQEAFPQREISAPHPAKFNLTTKLPSHCSISKIPTDSAHNDLINSFNALAHNPENDASPPPSTTAPNPPCLPPPASQAPLHLHTTCNTVRWILLPAAHHFSSTRIQVDQRSAEHAAVESKLAKAAECRGG